MALTAKQEQFCQGVALRGLNQSAAYSEAFPGTARTPESLASRASTLAALDKVAERINVLKERATAAAVAKSSYTLADALAGAQKAEELAHSVGQASGAVAAVTLQAKLMGLLVEKKEIRTGPLEDADVDKLLMLKAEVDAKIQRAKEAQELVGVAPVETPAVYRRIID